MYGGELLIGVVSLAGTGRLSGFNILIVIIKIKVS